MSIFLGIDQSLRHTGVFWLGDGVIGWRQIDSESRRGAERLLYIKSNILEVVEEQKPNYAAIEGYSYGSVGKLAELGELGGVIKMALKEVNVPVLIVAPTQVKKYITGNHQADKSDVIAAINTRLHMSWTSKDDNLADAAALALIMQAMYTATPPTLRHEAEVIQALKDPAKPKRKTVQRKKKFYKI